MPLSFDTEPTTQDSHVQISQEEADRVGDLEEIVSHLAKARATFEARTYVNGAFMDGDHFALFNRATGRLELERAPRGTINRVIQKGFKKMVEMKNTILSDDPRWQVHPVPADDGSFSDKAMADATNASDWLTDIATRKSVLKKRDDAVYYATWQPYTALGAFYDDETQEYEVKQYQFFDLLCDANISDFEESSYLVLQSMMPAREIRQNPDYQHTDGLKIDKRWAVSEWQNDRMNQKFGQQVSMKDPVKVYQIWQKVKVTKDIRGQVKKLNKDEHWIESKQDGDTILYFCTVAGGRLVRETYLPYHRYPVVAYHINDGQLIGPAPVERIIAANKSLDVQLSRKEQYVNEVAAGRVMKHKDVKIHRMTNAHGSVLEWEGDPNHPPVIPSIPDLPPVVQSLFLDTERFLSDLSVTGSDMLGYIHGSGGRGAQMIEALKSLDVSAMSTARKNLAYTLEQLADILLMLADYHQTQVSTVSHITDAGEHRAFKIVGGQAASTKAFKLAYPSEADRQPTVLSASMKVTVSIESGMAYTQEGKWNIIQNLVSMGALSVQSALTMLKVSGNVSQELRQMMIESGQTMLSSQDFQELDPDKRAQILQWLQQANISMPVNPKSIGSVRKLSTPTTRS